MKPPPTIINLFKTMKSWQKILLGIIVLLAIPLLLQSTTKTVSSLKHKQLAKHTALELEVAFLEQSGSPDLQKNVLAIAHEANTKAGIKLL